MKHLRTCSQKDLAELAGMTYQAVLRYEQFLFEHPSEKYIEALSEHTGLSKTTLKKEYYESKKNIQREALLTATGQIKSLPSLYMTDIHPFIYFRERLRYTSRIGFCKAFAINPATVIEYERGRVRLMPPSIRVALSNAGVSETYIDGLETLGKYYFKGKR